MKPTTFAASLGLAFSMSALAAQERLPEPTKEPAHNVFVLTGCLEKGSSPSAFRLTGASPIGQAPPRVNPSAASIVKDDVYELQAVTAVSEQGLSPEKLQSDVGARVEVTIRPVEAALAPAASPQSVAPDTAKKPAEAPRPRFTVVKLNRLADSCA
jgi:Tfp pilus assembly protein PilX